MAVAIRVVKVCVVNTVPVGTAVVVKSVGLNPEANNGARGKSTDRYGSTARQASIGYIGEDLNALRRVGKSVVVNEVAKFVAITGAFPYESYANIRPLVKLENTFLNEI